MQDPYNISQDVERKRALSMVLSQTKQQERRDAQVEILPLRILAPKTLLNRHL